MIKEDKKEALQVRMKKLGIHEGELIEKFILGSGSGGQKINKTSSCVYLKHLPSGIEIKCQKERSRELNRFYARRALCDRIEGQMEHVQEEKSKAIDKIRRQKRKRSKRAKDKMLVAKKLHGEKKSLRQPPQT